MAGQMSMLCPFSPHMHLARCFVWRRRWPKISSSSCTVTLENCYVVGFLHLELKIGLHPAFPNIMFFLNFIIVIVFARGETTRGSFEKGEFVWCGTYAPPWPVPFKTTLNRGCCVRGRENHFRSVQNNDHCGGPLTPPPPPPTKKTPPQSNQQLWWQLAAVTFSALET